MTNIIDREKCVGCAVCEANCPVNAIEMSLNSGYLAPSIDTSKCIDCGKCVQVCPERQQLIPAPQTDDIVLCKGLSEFWRESKSGGVFPIIARYFIEHGGCVVGAIIDDNSTVRHILTYDWVDVEKMRGSKYVQSDISGIAKRIKNELDKEVRVLFTGTPCQVHAIKHAIGENDNLYTIDLWCHGVGSPKTWDNHIKASFGDEKPVKVMYGNKENGRVAEIVYTYADGKKEIVRTRDDFFYQTLMREERMPSCIDCRYSQTKRQGDFTIGDLWYATRTPKYARYCNGNIPPSFIMFNTKKSKIFKEYIKSNSEFFTDISFIDIISKNRWGSIKNKQTQQTITAKPNPLIINKGYTNNSAVNYNPNDKRVALYGHTENENYGGCLTYYALGKAIESLGYNLTVIPRSSDVTKDDSSINFYNPDSPSIEFFKENFNMAERLPFSRFQEYNSLANTFVIGSDMMWCDKKYYWGRDTFYLNFVDDGKRKIAYAPSFGADNINVIFDPERISVVIEYLKSFDKISVREDWGKNFLTSLGIDCSQVPDPVFLLKKENYALLSYKAKEQTDKRFVLNYLLGKNIFKQAFEKSHSIAAEHNIEEVFITDGHLTLNESTRAQYPFFLPRPDIYQLMWYFAQADYVVTDSFHGFCFSLIFNKPFVWLAKDSRDIRAKSLARQIGMDLKSGDLNEPDYNKVNELLGVLRESGRQWLFNALSTSRKSEKSKFCVYSMIKNEQLYLDEWIQYHLNLGVDRIVLVEDWNSAPHDEIVKKYDKIELIHIKDILTSVEINHSFRQRHIIEWFIRDDAPKHNIDWGILLDIDEYLHMQVSLSEFAERYANCSAVHLYWKCYNANGHYKREPGTNYELYANETAAFLPKANYNTKFFVNINRANGRVQSVHYYYSGVDVANKLVTFRHNDIPIYSIAWIDHFITRSYEDWQIRLKEHPSLNARKNEGTFWLYNPTMKRPNAPKVSILIIHYNTPKATEALIKSINKQVGDCNIYIFDNSDREPFTYHQDNITYFDNTNGQYIDFDEELKKFPHKEARSNSNYGSFKHSISVQKCMDMLDIPVILLDSDVLLLSDISPLYNDAFIAGGDFLSPDPAQVYKKIRLVPSICFLNFPIMKESGLHYHYNDGFIDINPNVDNCFDTGGLLGLILKTQYINTFNQFKPSEYIVHYMHGSWNEEPTGGKPTIEQWLEDHKILYE